MIDQPYKPLPYSIAPARGQALLSFAGRRLPDHLPLFEVTKVEEVRPQQAASGELPGMSEVKVPVAPGLLLHGDCLSACAYLKANNIKVDLVYIDPPFASGANYAKKILLRNGFVVGVDNDDTSVGEEIMYGDVWQKEDYLNWLYERLLAMREVMSETGTIYVHLDWHIGHYVKVLLDEVFGEENFTNEIIWWYYNKMQGNVGRFAANHDIILCYTKSDDATFNQIREARGETVRQMKRAWDRASQKLTNVKDENGKALYIETDERTIDDVWRLSMLQPADTTENSGYVTQKPEELLERVVNASSNPGMTVADFFSGSGTTAAVAHKLGRRFIASDIGLNAIQTTRDRLVAAGAAFDVLKIQDGVRLFRNPAQTMAKIFSLVEGFKKREDLELGEFWDGGLPGPGGRYIPLKFVGLHERLTPVLVDYYLEEICQLETDERAEGVRILYAHRDPKVDQAYINKRLKESKRTTLRVDLISLNQLLDKKGASLFTPDSAILDVQPAGKGKWQVTVKQYFSTYLSIKITEFNAKRGKRNGEVLLDENGEGNGEDSGEETKPAPQANFKPVTISESGLELIEAIQFDTTLREDGVWISNSDLEDKAGPKQKVKGTYTLRTNKFRIKFRNIAGDEIVLESPPVKHK